MLPPCLTLSNIRYVSRVKWSNPGKGVTPSPTSWWDSYWKGSLLVALNYGRKLYLLYSLNLQDWSLTIRCSLVSYPSLFFFWGVEGTYSSIEDTVSIFWIPLLGSFRRREKRLLTYRKELRSVFKHLSFLISKKNIILG